jgi:hypothetical protein
LTIFGATLSADEVVVVDLESGLAAAMRLVVTAQTCRVRV